MEPTRGVQRGAPGRTDGTPMKPLTRILLYGSIALILGFIALFIE